MTIHLIKLQNTPIEKQLAVEEKLLREDTRSFVVIGTEVPEAVVMGSSQKQEDVVHVDKAQAKGVPIIQRYSAGGCVILDKDTIMVSFILNKADVEIDLFPNTIMDWSETFYKNALPIDTFNLSANDYVIGNRKVGGNAQYIKKDRFVHHTSFLWDYCSHHMNILTHPPKEPKYREKRVHDEFLTTLKPHLTKESFIDCIEKGLKGAFNRDVQRDQTFC